MEHIQYQLDYFINDGEKEITQLTCYDLVEVPPRIIIKQFQRLAVRRLFQFTSLLSLVSVSANTPQVM